MTDILSLIGLSIGLLVVFSFALVSSDVEQIKANWATRRCEIPIMMSAFLYKPSFYTGSASQFSSENFAFCTRKLADDVIKAAFAPLFGIAAQQAGAQQSLAGPMNSIRIMIQNGWKQFANMMDQQFRQYKALIVRATATYHHIRFAMGRVGAMVTSFIYLAFSLLTTMNNTFTFMMNMLLIFIGIMAAMILFLWFGILPFLGIIIPTITLFATASSETDGWLSPDVDGGLIGAFCVDPEASVFMADGSLKPLKDITLGDSLQPLRGHKEKNIVTGILSVNAESEPLVVVQGVLMSQSHRVLYKGQWILAKQHPEAVQTNHRLPTLICLNTSHHGVAVRTQQGTILYVGDWEEIDSVEGQRQWIDWVHLKLNGSPHRTVRYPTSVPLCGNAVQVCCQRRGWIPLHAIQRGDSVLGQRGFTKVTGIYEGQLYVDTLPNTPDWITDGVWVQHNRFWTTRSSAVRETDEDKHRVLHGKQLVTAEGTFLIQQSTGISVVRDFTEVGVEAIAESYSWLDVAINKKAQPNQKCAQVYS